MGTAFQVDIAIRPEQEVDRDQIHDLTKRAFAPMAFAAGDEQDLINALRDADALTISLVAVQDGEVVGHIAFSPANSADGEPGWFALGPVSVAPEVQGLGSEPYSTLKAPQAGRGQPSPRNRNACSRRGCPSECSRPRQGR